MESESKKDFAKDMRKKYCKASKKEKSRLLDFFCEMTHVHRKYACHVLSNRLFQRVKKAPAKKRRYKYPEEVVLILKEIWEAANYPWSNRLKALLPIWLPWVKEHFPTFQDSYAPLLLQMSSRQMDRRLRLYKIRCQKKLYGRTKPGTLLKHHIPIATHAWDVKQPGYLEVDLVSHSGNNADGHFAYSLNATDIFTGWVETQAILGKGEQGVLRAFKAIRQRFPFPILGIDSDNGSEFINHTLWKYCQEERIGFTRGRPYKKDDNAHIEQKNWTHVRKLMGWLRYDTSEAVVAMNDLYSQDLRIMMNFFQPTIKIIRKERVGAKLCRKYDQPKTPWERLMIVLGERSLSGELKVYHELWKTWDPFKISRKIDEKISKIHELANKSQSPRPLIEKQGAKHVA